MGPGPGPVRLPGQSSYRVAREYMIRLDRGDLADPDKLRPIAEASGLTPEAFHDRYGYQVQGAGPHGPQRDPARSS